MVFKKDLTPIGGKRGVVNKHAGKGSFDQRTRGGQRESLTGGSPFGRAVGRYPKAPPPSSPAGMTPPFGIGAPPEEE